MFTRIYHWPALLLAFLFAMLATAAQAGPFDVPLYVTLNVQEQIVPDPSCPSGFSGTLTSSGTGTQPDEITVSAPHCATPTGNGSVTLSRGTITFARNGETLSADFMGTISPIPGGPETNTFTGNFLITGGTGRFANTAGNGLLSGTLSGSLATSFYTGIITAEGTIGYIGY